MCKLLHEDYYYLAKIYSFDVVATFDKHLSE